MSVVTYNYLQQCPRRQSQRRGSSWIDGGLFETRARTQLVSQWSVKDESTGELMHSFYASLTQRKMAKCAALRQAALSLLAKPAYGHPNYCSPFILLGDWRERVHT